MILGYSTYDGHYEYYYSIKTNKQIGYSRNKDQFDQLELKDFYHWINSIRSKNVKLFKSHTGPNQEIILCCKFNHKEYFY